jgi:TRAP-type C4-dicarboxylate transport system substrate-binding protein
VRRLAILTIIAALLAAWPGRAETVLYLAHTNRNDALDAPTSVTAVTFKQAVERESRGAIRVEIFPEAQLGGDPSVIKLARAGIIQGGIVAIGGLNGIYPPIAVLNYPFAWSSLAETYQVFDGPFMDALRDDFAARTGLYLAGFADTGGLFLISNSRRAIRSPADMAGLRIRTMGLQSHKDMVKALGAEPVELPWTELPTALKAGVVDGQMNPASLIRVANLDQVQRYLTLTEHLYTPYALVLNGGFLAGLDAEGRRAVTVGAREAILASRQLAQGRGDDLTRLTATMTVTRLSAAEREAFRRATQPAVAKTIADTLGEDGVRLLDRMNQAIAAARATPH